ncbi:acyl-CoA-binding protein [Rhizophagus irregularis]|uniref:Acyl-CoA-binding protein n=3 Tax=Rhizophagus irregularis TaxID=588596 RepID=U9UXE4_RHIID|nr:acyl-CoA-binding protein [Rhizophagus irregularis DAOM 181602=DAOM 197198]EXX62568.1 long-chain fatty acid transporter ACB1 [Rhizophagus irregularis DAOM 197198w]PKC16026.1 acyl-CoA-binding protein [Rhizophagus irregularis]PKC74335.1 acyl-CoA-binding protein [Rhizophagus irregularis]PKK69269.1 acyl-CoA-binding protein [Rhizophagus irregularis]PKY15472.1 acyl-CoA-binding protein [Rhizophagus irregularis]|eukprot:XP_025187584.1 acyl-CoA-binding protein [Rhizophagus irregularis DAOM 181602=DAOM 197198]
MTDINRSAEFDAAAKEFEEVVKNHNPSDEDKLEGYALFKQGSFGDNTKPEPGFFARTDKAKWNAYNTKKGITPEDAQKQYVDFVAKMKEKYGS